ncbi:putative phage abortive infection protein [Lactococcus lactis]|uniref:putative phage abortive infection protein n=1 Tax=Lactococcus lactis TaxID=1358 RepID=UPI0037C69E15
MDILFLEKALTNSDWLGFKGNILSGIIGLIGAILGVLGAYLVMKKQLKAENEQYRKDKVDNTFFNLLGLFQNVRDELDSSKLLDSIRRVNFHNKKVQKDKYYEKIFDSKNSEFIEHIEKLSKKTIKIDECFQLIDELKQKNYNSEAYIRRLNDLERAINYDKTYIGLFKECAKDLIDFVDDKNREITFKYETDEKVIKKCVEDVFLNSKYYSGNYFRALYRCLKYIMDSELTIKDKKFYSGVLRGILSSDEMLVVFYNCMYFEKGEKFKELLEKEEEKGKRIDFFGDEEDLKNLDKGYDLPFFSKKDLIFSEKDMQKLKELIKGN